MMKRMLVAGAVVALLGGCLKTQVKDEVLHKTKFGFFSLTGACSVDVKDIVRDISDPVEVQAFKAISSDDNTFGGAVTQASLDDVMKQLSTELGVEFVALDQILSRPDYQKLPSSGACAPKGMVPLNVTRPASASAVGEVVKAMGLDGAFVVEAKDWRIKQSPGGLPNTYKGVTAFKVSVVGPDGELWWKSVYPTVEGPTEEFSLKKAVKEAVIDEAAKTTNQVIARAGGTAIDSGLRTPQENG